MQIFEEKHLRPYLKDALADFRKKYRSHQSPDIFRGRFVYPSGSGKTSLESYILKDMITQDGNRVHLVLAPRIVLVNQLMREFRKYIGQDYIGLAFHSGRSEPDFTHVKWTENSTTNPKFAAEELDRAHSLGKDLVIFSTYHSADRLLPFSFHTMIADESQYCLEFFNVVRKIQAMTKLFFTATEKHNKNNDVNISLDNKKLFGDIISQGRIRDLIEGKYLVPPRLHVMTAFKDKTKDFLTGKEGEMNSFIDEAVSIAEIQNKETRKTMPFSKILFACKGTEDVKIVTERIKELKKAIPTHRIFTIVSNQRYGCQIDGKKMTRDEFMRELKEDTNALIFHFDILSEGIDVDGITGVAIMRNMNHAKLLQTIGRGVRIYKPNPKLKREALISVPIINHDDDTKSMVKNTILAMREGGFEVNSEEILFNDDRNPGIGLEEELDAQYDLSRRKKAQTFLDNVFHELEDMELSSFEYSLKKKTTKKIIDEIKPTKSNLKYTELSLAELYRKKNGLKGGFASFNHCLNSFKNIKINDKNTFGIIHNLEFIMVLLYKKNIDPSKIVFFSNCENKRKIVEKFGIRYIDIKELNIFNPDLDDLGLDDINQYTKFTYTILYPYGKMNMELLDLARKITKKNIIFVGECSAYLSRPEILNYVSYFQILARKKYNNLISMIINLDICQKTKVNFKNRNHIVDKFNITPGFNNLQEWKYANEIIDKNIPGINLKTGYRRISDFNNKKGIKLIHSIGDADEENFGDIFYVENNKKISGFGKHKVLIDRNCTKPGSIGAIKYAKPEFGVGNNILYIETKDVEEATEYIKYLQSKKVTKLYYGIKGERRYNAREFFLKIPRLKYQNMWK